MYIYVLVGFVILVGVYYVFFCARLDIGHAGFFLDPGKIPKNEWWKTTTPTEIKLWDDYRETEQSINPLFRARISWWKDLTELETPVPRYQDHVMVVFREYGRSLGAYSVLFDNITLHPLTKTNIVHVRYPWEAEHNSEGQMQTTPAAFTSAIVQSLDMASSLLRAQRIILVGILGGASFVLWALRSCPDYPIAHVLFLDPIFRPRDFLPFNMTSRLGGWLFKHRYPEGFNRAETLQRAGVGARAINTAKTQDTFDGTATANIHNNCMGILARFMAWAEIYAPLSAQTLPCTFLQFAAADGNTTRKTQYNQPVQDEHRAEETITKMFHDYGSGMSILDKNKRRPVKHLVLYQHKDLTILLSTLQILLFQTESHTSIIKITNQS